MGEGADIPYLDTLLVVAPVSWKGIVSQYVGRISREYNGKKEVCIYDYVDINIPAFVSMYSKRLNTYRKLGYVAADGNASGNTEATTGLKSGSFYSETDIYPALCALIANTKHSIVISSPRLELNYGTSHLIEQLLSAVRRNVAIEVLCSSVEDSAQAEAAARLKENGISVSFISNCYLKFATFDNQIFLFGELNLLGGYINVTKSFSETFSEPSVHKVMILGSNAEICRTLTEPNLFEL